MLGGSGHFQTDPNADRYSRVSVSPHAGYFLSDRLAIGTGLDAFSNRNGEFKVSGFEVSPFARYYLPVIDSKLSLMLEAGGGYGQVTSTSFSGDYWRAQGGGGLSYFLTPTFAVEGFLGARATLSEGGESNLRHHFRLGFQAFLSKQTRAEPQSISSEVIRKRSLMLGAVRSLTLNSIDHRLEPLALYMLTDHIGVGAALSVPQYGVQPLLRYFPGNNKKGRLRPYAGAGANFEWMSSGSENRNFRTAPFAEAGAMYFLSPNLALDAGLRYQFNLNGNDKAAGFRSGPLFRMGVQYFLPSKR